MIDLNLKDDGTSDESGSYNQEKVKVPRQPQMDPEDEV